MKKKYYYIIFTLLVACDLGEVPVDPRPSGLLTTTTIEMMENYQMQVYFDLYNNNLISENLRTDWDLAFESNPNGWRININSSKFMQVWEVDNQSYNSPLDLSNAIWRWDHQSGSPDSTAVGDYRNKESFYVIDRGYNNDNSQIGYKKLNVESVNSDSYTIRLANIEGSIDTIIEIPKNLANEKIYFSFNDYSIKDIEPSHWDLLFTTYTHLFSSNFPYLVSGVLTNTSHVKVVKDTTYHFDDISFENIKNFDFSTDQNIIGYDWKSYDLNTGVFTINSSINYIIETNSQKYFKLRFLDFYNENGTKGYPKFEYKEL